jgi:hypothetical protein
MLPLVSLELEPALEPPGLVAAPSLLELPFVP